MTEASLRQACDLILFGACGDLSTKKLLPALYQLEKSNLLHPQTRIIAIDRQTLSEDAFIDFTCTQISLSIKEKIDRDTFEQLQAKLHYLNMNLTEPNDYLQLKNICDPAIRRPISYFATPPTLFGVICQGISIAGLAVPSARVVMEKPIGHDLNSSIQIHNKIAQYFTEDQIYRIDHYLGKDTVLNLLVLRFANTIFMSLWDHHAIDQVQITVAEELGVAGRWDYYDQAGQVADMLQNHLLQILSCIAMEPPGSLDAASIRHEKLKVLKALRPITHTNVQNNTVRGQYIGGSVHGETVPGYLEEKGGKLASQTETFVAVEVNIDNWRWYGVPFYLRTGKRMLKKHSEVVIYFKPQRHHIFKPGNPHLAQNKLVIRLQPNEGVEIHIMNKLPELKQEMCLQQTGLNVSFNETFKTARIADAYERLLLEVMLGRQYLFVSREEVEHAWLWVDGLLNAWRNDSTPLHTYQAGTWGPISADTLLTRTGRSWNEPS